MKYRIGIAVLIIAVSVVCWLLLLPDDASEHSRRYNTAQQTETTAETTLLREELEIESIMQYYGTEPDIFIPQSSTETVTVTVQTAPTSVSTVTTAADLTTETTTGTETGSDAPQLPAFRIGDTVNFGAYDWYVIGVTDTDMTLLCTKSVGKMCYDASGQDVTWENCSLRRWLNESFYGQFSDEEKAQIVLTECRNADNAAFGTDGGADTEDYVRLLSAEEADALTIRQRMVYGWWWLRSPGATQKDAAVVHSDGGIGSTGFQVNAEFGVRPVLTIRKPSEAGTLPS